MRQKGVKFQCKNKKGAYSSMGGLVLVDEVSRRFRIDRAVDIHIGTRSSGVRFRDSDCVKSIVSMQILGGETVDGLKLLRAGSCGPAGVG